MKPLTRESSLCIHTDLTNPGHFFACCGLLELANRLWPGSTGWFEASNFRIDSIAPPAAGPVSYTHLTLPTTERV